VTRRPFRAPHHTISVSGLVGGGSPPHRARSHWRNRGVLFRTRRRIQPHVLESLRQPPGRKVRIGARRGERLPARFQLSPPRIRAAGCRLARSVRLHAADARATSAVSGPCSTASTCTWSSRRDARRSRGAPTGDDAATVPGVSPVPRPPAARFAAPEHSSTPSSRHGHSASLSAAGGRRGTARRGDAQLGLSARGHDRVLRVAARSRPRRADALAAMHVAEALQYRGSTGRGVAECCATIHDLGDGHGGRARRRRRTRALFNAMDASVATR